MMATTDLSRLYDTAPDTTAFRKRRKRLVRLTEEAISRYAMVSKPGARWLVCLSGGKDSYTLLTLLMDLKAQGRLDVDLVAANLDQAQPGFPTEVLPHYLEGLGLAHRIDRRDTYSTVIEKTAPGQTLCTLCSRLRRGHLYRMAREEGCDAIALGHHADDILETFFLNLFHGGRLEAMSPNLMNDEGDVQVVRPLTLVREADIVRFAEDMAYPIIPCTLCGSQDGMARQTMKAMIASWDLAHPGRSDTILRALGTIRPSHLLDDSHFDFSSFSCEPKSNK
ncbi:tRNA 2-thiocytidine(32) synthetase TtcA [Parvularcula bermudensis]|nr:tRNA 2-thiocytidine(32) synthetase TtcA [Parvularcula bermudensis]